MKIELNWNELRKNKIFIATPMYGGNANGLYIKSILNLQQILMQAGIENKFSFLFNESLIPRARNYLTEEFLNSEGYTHMLFIDADVEFDAKNVIELLALDKDIIGGPYPKKSIKWSNIKKAEENAKNRGVDLHPNAYENIIGDFVFNPVPGTKEFNAGELVEVMEIGTGFMMVKRKVFDVLKEEFPHLRYKPDHIGQEGFDGSKYIHAYFHCEIDPDTHRYLSEDYFFCQSARAAGMSIWYCPWMVTTHVGTYGFRGNLIEVANKVGSI